MLLSQHDTSISAMLKFEICIAISNATMASVTWRDIITYMWNDSLRAPVVLLLRVVAGGAILILIGHYTYVYSWYMVYGSWPSTVDMLIGVGLTLLYVAALTSITVCACVIRGEFDPTYLAVVLTSSIAVGASIGPFLPLTIRTPPNASTYMFDGVAVVMLLWFAVTAVYCVVQIARLVCRDFMEYVQYIRSELTRKCE